MRVSLEKQLFFPTECNDIFPDAEHQNDSNNFPTILLFCMLLFYMNKLSIIPIEVLFQTQLKLILSIKFNVNYIPYLKVKVLENFQNRP